MAKRVENHGLIAKLFHWGFVVVFAYAIFKQLNNLEELRDAALLRFEIVFAIGFLLLLALRYFYMRWAGATALPEESAAHVKLLARLGHWAIYGSLALIALSGLMIGFLFSAGIETGLLMDTAIGLHEFSVIASFVMIAVHIAAALFHRLKGDGVWSAMVPIWKEKQ